ncbi:hypothetical protein GCM10025762_48630 [Haloechinothrix salitolerans]
MVGGTEALAHPARPTRRLLDMASSWPDSLPDQAQSGGRATPCKLARQLRTTDVDQLVAIYQSGASIRKLAKQFGLHTQTVSRHLRSRGIDTNPAAMTAAKLQTAALLYKQGWSLRQLAAKYDADDETIRRLLRQQGATMRAPGTTICDNVSRV